MSFSSEIKAELCEAEDRRECCLRAECYGAWLFSRCFSLMEGFFVTENGSVARRMLELAAAGAGAAGKLSYTLSRRDRAVYRLSLPEEEERAQMLSAFGHSGRETGLRINRAVLEDEEAIPAFLRGAFLSCGSATDPQKEYHLEFAVPYKTLANSLYTLLSEVEVFSAPPLLAPRKGGFVVYWKDGGQIEDFLTFIGAPRASMALMQVRMYKEAKNHINRRTNFETANMDKTYSASARQTAAIAALMDSGAYNALPEALKALASLRLEHPEMTLRELSETLGISRSGTNHRMNRLLELGERLLEEQGSAE